MCIYHCYNNNNITECIIWSFLTFCAVLVSFLDMGDSPSSEEQFACPICKASFAKIQSFYGHLQTHRWNKFPCGLCDETFDMMAKLWKHERIHLNTHRPISCGQCDQTFEKYELLVKWRVKGWPTRLT